MVISYTWLIIGKDVGEQLWFYCRVHTPLQSLLADNRMKAVPVQLRNLEISWHSFHYFTSLLNKALIFLKLEG